MEIRWKSGDGWKSGDALLISSLGPFERGVLRSTTRRGFDASKADGQVLGVAEEVGIGGEDLQVLGRGHGADQEIGRRALELSASKVSWAPASAGVTASLPHGASNALTHLPIYACTLRPTYRLRPRAWRLGSQALRGS